MQSLPKDYILAMNKIRIDMLINQLSDIQNEEQVTDKKVANKKIYIRTIYTLIGGIVLLNLVWWLISQCM
jgi:plastocyanin domain-containing protein